MKLGLAVPSIHNYEGLVQSINSVKSSKYEFQHYIRDNNEDNWGCARSWNWGIKSAFDEGCDLAFVMNDDVILREGVFDYLVDEFIQNPQFMVLSGIDARDFREDETRKFIESTHYSCFLVRPELFTTLKAFEDNKYGEKTYTHEGKEVRLKNGWFDENIWPVYFEDSDFGYRLKLAGLQQAKLTDAVFDHFGSHSKYHDPNHVENFQRIQRYYQAKWGGMPHEEKFILPFNQNNEKST